MPRKIKQYVSEIDQFLMALDKEPSSTSKNRIFEEQKYKKVHSLRDNADKDAENNKIWDKF